MKRFVLGATVCLCLLPSVFAQETTVGSEPIVAKAVFRKPLSEVGQSGVCLSGDRLFLTVHKDLEGPLKGDFYFSRKTKRFQDSKTRICSVTLE